MGVAALGEREEARWERGRRFVFSCTYTTHFAGTWARPAWRARFYRMAQRRAARLARTLGFFFGSHATCDPAAMDDLDSLLADLGKPTGGGGADTTTVNLTELDEIMSDLTDSTRALALPAYLVLTHHPSAQSVRPRPPRPSLRPCKIWTISSPT